MIGSIRGQILLRQENWSIIETANGIGYKIFVGNQPLSDREEVLLYTYHHVREDYDDLYGFSDYQDLQMFELLLSVSGVGPKMALAIQSTLGSATISEAISSHQSAIFKSVSGVGQKVAEKIILELKGKVENSGSLSVQGEANAELFEALIGLGYKQNEVVKVMKELDPTANTTTRLKDALRLLKK